MTPAKPDWQSARAKLRKISDLLADLTALGELDLRRMRLRPSAGLRNILVHEYTKIDYQRVVDSIPAAIREYGRYVEQAARWLLERQKVSGGT